MYDPPLPEGFRLGQRSSDPVLAVKPGALTLARNCDIGPDGSLRVRRSAQTISDRILESNDPIDVMGLSEYQTASAREVITAGGTRWVKWDATGTSKTVTALTGATGLTAGQTWSLVRWRDGSRNWLIGGNGTDALRYYNGTSVATVASAATDTNIVLPLLQYLAVWNDYVWGATATSNVLRFSDFSNPTSYPAAHYFLINDTSGGSITGIGPGDEWLLYFTRNQTNVLTGLSRRSFGVKQQFRTVGCVAHQTIQNTDMGLIWMDDDGLYLYDGSRPQRLSQPIDDVFRSLDFSQITNCWSVYYKHPQTKLRKYIVAVTQQGRRANATWIEYTLDTDAWTVHTGEAAVALCRGHDGNDFDVLYTANADAELQRHDQDTGDRVPVDFNIITRPLDGGSPEYRQFNKVLQRVFIFYQADNAVQLQARVTTNFRGAVWPSSGTKTVSLSADVTIPAQYQYDQVPIIKHFLSAAQARLAILNIDEMLEGRHFQVQLKNNEGGRQFRILDIVAEMELTSTIAA